MTPELHAALKAAVASGYYDHDIVERCEPIIDAAIKDARRDAEVFAGAMLFDLAAKEALLAAADDLDDICPGCSDWLRARANEGTGQ